MIRTATRTLAAAAVAVSLVACSSDDQPSPQPVDTTPIIDPTVDDGISTETDEGLNTGFEDDEPSGRVGELDGDG